MPEETLYACTLAIIVVTVVTSFIGFQDPGFRERFIFDPQQILAVKQYHRTVTCAFLHADWAHLAMNMITLYLFGGLVEQEFGMGKFLLIYFGAIFGGSLLSLWIHRHHEYRAYGASGGTCGMIFSFIMLFPGGEVGMFFLPLYIPGWLYAIVFLGVSLFALKRNADNIGHDAHIGGAVVGMWISAALVPGSIQAQPITFAGISFVSILLFIYLVKNPMFLSLDAFIPERKGSTRSKREMPPHKIESLEVDVILEKISKEGMDSLTPDEKRTLARVAEKFQNRSSSEKPKSGLTI